MRSFLFSLHFFLLSFSLILTESEAQSIALLPRALLCQEKLLRRIQIREKGICIKDFIPSGNKNPVGIGQQQPVDLPAADDERLLLLLPQQGKQLRKIRGNLGPRSTKAAA